MLFSYNREHVGDVLMVIVADDANQENQVERRKNVARIVVKATGETVAWNIFDVSQIISTLEGCGQVYLSDAQLELVNQVIKQAGFTEQLQSDTTQKLVIGHVKSCKKHPDSTHLSVTQIEVDHGEVLQIVCGAPNIKAGQKVVVARPGAMLPDGTVIWPGMLRGVESFGMVCSARELGLLNASTKKGILELPFDAVVGSSFKEFGTEVD